ncbi:hypothetical protein KUTeg_005252 [Tegillarca granosa]|uniref:Integrase core domain-containing protein n=1 Tax=Tegillarca granosa TaxID=220873 RepID=A0ABQ9FJ71_TEGGR|nr:hypothetical protein KUTeg_005252 [Tegillarca granosa]
MDREEVIFVCHYLGFSQRETLEVLSHNYGIFLSQRQLRRILRQLNLYRRIRRTDILNVAEFISDRLNESGMCHGYRFMHLKCILNGISVSREIEDNGYCPEILRGDRGTENDNARQIQTFFHYMQQNTTSLHNCFLYGKSTANQRIESFWRQLRSQKLEFWISFFHELKESGHFNGDRLEKEIVRFVFMDILQAELDEFSLLWNIHTIRKSTNDQLCHGRPVTMYTTPTLYDTRDYSVPVERVLIEACREECTFKTEICCDREVHELCRLIMDENDWQMPENAISARHLYTALRIEIFHNL